MTTTTDKMRNRVIGLMDRARHESTPGHEAAACRQKAEELVKKYDLPVSLLTATSYRTHAVRNNRPSYTQPERRYPCRFGCGTYTQHTIDEMNACAERRRNETGRDSAYAETPRRRASGSTFDDMFRDFFGAGYAGGGHHERTSYNTSHSRTGSESRGEGFRATPKARATGSHANCDHPATKSARAHCRKMRSAGF